MAELLIGRDVWWQAILDQSIGVKRQGAFGPRGFVIFPPFVGIQIGR